jgi:hypothetical protein
MSAAVYAPAPLSQASLQLRQLIGRVQLRQAKPEARTSE